MPICEPCRGAADGTAPQGPLVTFCPICDRRIQSASDTYGPDLDGDGMLARHSTLARHGTREDRRFRCEGSSTEAVLRPAWTGHDNCTGCPCQHRPKGSWNARPEDQ